GDGAGDGPGGRGATARLFEPRPKLGDRFAEAAAADGDPALGVLGDGVEQLGTGGAADEHRQGPVYRLGPRPRRRQVHELAVEGGLLVLPETPHRQDMLAAHLPAAAVIDAVVLHLVLVPAHADAEG